MNRNPEELDHVMLPVKALTQLDPIDGFRLMLGIQPWKMLRLSGTWNYANIGKSGFNVCGAWLNQPEEEEGEE